MFKMNLKFIGTIFLLFILPIIVIAQSGTTGGGTNTTGGSGTIFGLTYECAPQTKNGVEVYGECTFADLVAAILNVINWGTYFALGFSVIVIAYAGFRYMISGDNPGERAKANKMLRTVAIGIFIIICAWLIVNLIMSALLDKSTGVSSIG